MTKKSILLTLLLIGSLVTPQETKPLGGPPAFIWAMMSAGAAVITTTVSTAYGAKGYIERYHRAKNCVQDQKDISFYTVTLTVQKREDRDKKFTTILTKYLFRNTNYSELIAEVKGYTEHLIEHQLKHEPPKTVLRFTLNSQVTLKTDKTITLREKHFCKTARSIDQEFILKITKALKTKFAIPSWNWRYKKKTAILWCITTLPFIGLYIYFMGFTPSGPISIR